MICGAFADPKHGHCLRWIEPREGGCEGEYVVHGWYGDDETGTPNTRWTATMRASGKFLTVDFDGKSVTHAKRYSALWCPGARQIHWEDGNVWQMLYGGI